MNKHKVFHCRIKALSSIKDDIHQTIKTGKKNIQKKNVAYFATRESFRKFLSSYKLEILINLKHHEFESVYHLARFLGRDYSSVLADINALDSSGFITLIKSKKGNRDVSSPSMAFDYDVISFEDDGYHLLFPLMENISVVA
jgi:predicted transcriptional regulator